ncbi:MAG: LPS export ABC transporter permease LptF [Mesorhizobium amorphae]|nr:MAG: LPS export ABC transporter permease LptF [Mesorhizobium amorphae]
MKVLERYILRRVFVMFAGTLLWTLAIVWTTQVLARIDLVTDTGQSALAFFQVATLILPSVVPLVVSFAVLIGVTQTLSTMNSDSELMVINAAGAPRRVVLKPIILLAAAASVFAFVVDNSIDPYARQKGRELVATARADLLSLVIQEGNFRKVEDGLFVQIAQRQPDGRLGGIFIADSRVDGVDLVYYAKSGVVVKRDGRDLLLMQDGEVQRKTASGDVSIIRFTSNAFDLASFSGGDGEVRLLPKDRTLGELFDPDPNDRIFQRSPRDYTAEIHRRLTEWVYPLVFGMIALAVAGAPRSARENRIHPLLTAAVIAMFERWLGFFTANEVQRSDAFIPLVYLVPFGTIAVCAVVIWRDKTLELPTAWVERLSAFFKRLIDRMTFLRGSGREAEDAA